MSATALAISAVERTPIPDALTRGGVSFLVARARATLARDAAKDAASDAAFAGYPHLIQDLLGYQSMTGSHNDAAAFPDTSKIVALVRSHVVAGKHMPAECAGKSMSVTTLAGTPLVVDGTQTPAQVTWTSVVLGRPLTASLVSQPIVCSNAVIYILDRIDMA